MFTAPFFPARSGDADFWDGGVVASRQAVAAHGARLGYLAPATSSNAPLTVRHMGNTTADPLLKRSHIKITLDRLRVAAYPGGGARRVLFDFYAQNQVPGGGARLHFSATYRAREGEQAAILGFPIFVGLNAGAECVAFKRFPPSTCVLIGMKRSPGFLESDVFKVALASTVQPAIAPFRRSRWA